MAGGRNKVKARVDAVVDRVLSVDLALLLEEGIKTLVDGGDDGLPAGGIVDEIAVARGVEDVDLELDALLLDGGRVNLDRHLGCGLFRGLLGDARLKDGRAKESVDKGRLAQARLACEGRRVSVGAKQK